MDLSFNVEKIMIGFSGKTLQSERLTYRLLTDGDKSPLKLLLNARDVTAPAGFLPAENDTEFDRFFENLTKYGTGVAVLLDFKLIGYFHVNKYHADGYFADKNCVGVGFVIGKAHQGQGYGKEMLKAMSSYLTDIFDACFGDAFSDNIRSIRTLEACGYSYVDDYSLFFDELGEKKTCKSYVYTK